MWVKPDEVVSADGQTIRARYRGQWYEVKAYNGWTGYAILGQLLSKTEKVQGS